MADTSNWSKEDWDNYMEGVAVSQGVATPSTAAQYVGAPGTPYGGGEVAATLSGGGEYTEQDPFQHYGGAIVKPVAKHIQKIAASGVVNVPEWVPGLGGEWNLNDLLPGGAPAHIGVEIPGGTARTWYTGTATFGQGKDGKYYVYLKKQARWKRYRPGGALVIGKAYTPKNARKVIRAKKHWAKLTKLANKINPKHRRERRAVCR